MEFPLPTVSSTPIVEEKKESPKYIRLSAASAMALRLQSGRFAREFEFGGINLLLNYDNGCLSDCGYCGLARSRTGTYEEKSFIRVDWPLYETDLVIQRMAKYEEKMTRLCISMVTHGSAYNDTYEITEKVCNNVKTPLSLLVAPPTLNRKKLQALKDLGADMIGVGLDAITENVFFDTRTNVPKGGLKWKNYWDIINYSREIYGAWKVNIHTVVGLGETDKDLVDMFYDLKSKQILAYLFCFNPEPDSRMGMVEKSTIVRWRRIQLIKHLIEEYHLDRKSIHFDEAGNITGLESTTSKINKVIKTLDGGVPFMTNGCPGENGEVGCTRPYGSYRPSESYRDFPFLPATNDMALIRRELELENLIL
ncbi:MAG TPA: radical SAM protein [Saprospiraceae bacterium]|nr:radical SAM protein [Saprospiraceae bacterium]